MANVPICVRGLAEEENHVIGDVGILCDVPRISQSLSHTLDEDIVADFGIPYPILPDRNSCDLLLRTDYQDLITRLPGPGSIIKRGNLQTSHAPVGWVISRWQDKPKCEIKQE